MTLKFSCSCNMLIVHKLDEKKMSMAKMTTEITKAWSATSEHNVTPPTKTEDIRRTTTSKGEATMEYADDKYKMIRGKARESSFNPIYPCQIVNILGNYHLFLRLVSTICACISACTASCESAGTLCYDHRHRDPTMSGHQYFCNADAPESEWRCGIPGTEAPNKNGGMVTADANCKAPCRRKEITGPKCNVCINTHWNFPICKGNIIKSCGECLISIKNIM